MKFSGERTLGVARWLTAVPLLIAVIVLVCDLTGWTGAPSRVVRGVAATTAVGMAALAVALIATSFGRARLAGAARALVLCAAAVGIASLFVDHPNATDAPAWFRLVSGTSLAIGGRMAADTALALLLVAASVTVRRRVPLADLLAAGGLLIPAAALLGFLYDASRGTPALGRAVLAMPTAVGIVCLALSAMLIEPRLGWSSVLLSRHVAGGATRRQLGLLLVVPVLAGWLLQEAMTSGRMRPGAAFSLMVILVIVPMALMVLRDGRRQMAIEIARDEITAAQAAAALDLEKRLAAKTDELAEQFERAADERSKAESAMYRSQRVEAIAQLTGGIAHDFNNLLAAISGNLELLTRKLPDDHPARRNAAAAAGAVVKGAKLANQLLAFSRTQRLAIQPTEMAPALLRVRELIRNALGPAIQLLLEFPREPMWARTDPDQFELAILNLAVNAREAMPDGGELRIEGAVRRLRLPPANDERTYVSIRVVDTGAGMTPEVLAKAIEPFFTTREHGKGPGLGLAQVYGFVRQCEGDLLIDSATGRGTSVEMLLPQTEAPAPERALPGPLSGETDRARAMRRRLLVVDDDDAVRSVMVELLAHAGYDVVQASGGVEAMARLDEMTPDAAVIDFLMPGMNGAEVARRAQARVQHLPIVFVSGYSETLALDGIAGAVVLRKPFAADQLQRAIESAIADPVV